MKVKTTRAIWKLFKRLHERILWVDLQKNKDNIKNKIEGHPWVERENLSRPFWFCKQFWNIPTPLWFSRNALRERPKHFHLNNTLPSENYNWNSSGFQLTQKKTRPRKYSLRFLTGRKQGRKSRWNMTANQKTANHKYCLSTNQRKHQNLVFEHTIRQVNVSCPPSPRLNIGREGMITG